MTETTIARRPSDRFDPGVANGGIAIEAATISIPVARLAIAFSAAVLALLAALHLVSPEFDPSWRAVSEYALGRYPWILSLLFAAWALSSWALVFTLRSQVRTRGGRVGLVFLVIAGVGEAMAAIWDITQDLHGLAALFGIFGLPLAAVLISVSLCRSPLWAAARQPLLRFAHLTWVSVVLLILALIVMAIGYTQAGNRMTPDVIAFSGWANRFLIVVYCAWVMVVGRAGLIVRRQFS